MHEVVFGEKNEEDASSHRNVSFTYSGGDVKLIYKRNNLHIKQLDAFCRFLIFLCLRKIRNLFMIWTVWPQMFHLLGENCAVLAVKLVDKTKCTERLPMSI
ncbi:hypothetical protein A6574_12260 [Escherichia coli]|nr:hypothetical protein A6574_12260 [Escherichia coli]